ncbi:hypothetical protein SAMN04488012_12019 [Palleronia salina]|uniref:Uncharacterized protein n=1 Tax=Palleronia salina TaxID=313368 RepID=A0A1M6M579_9RHOB|nr:hypothetical protein [Palleronia salina]SHJ78621.1 hypothetical protein SAMN04488012_12019 [Palleronia salina]
MTQDEYAPALDCLTNLLATMGRQRPNRAIEIAYLADLLDGSMARALLVAAAAGFAPHPIYSGLWVAGWQDLKRRPNPYNPTKFGDLVTDVLDALAPIELDEDEASEERPHLRLVS